MCAPPVPSMMRRGTSRLDPDGAGDDDVLPSSWRPTARPRQVSVPDGFAVVSAEGAGVCEGSLRRTPPSTARPRRQSVELPFGFGVTTLGASPRCKPPDADSPG